MYTLMGSPKNRSFRVLWMLEELQADYDVKPLAARSKEMFAVNPAGKAPVLQDGDEVIIDSVAIVQYLADKHGQFTAKAGTIARAQQDSFTFFAVDDIDGTLWTNAKHDFVLPEELRVPAVKAACEWDLKRALKAFEQRLGDRQYVMGDEFSVPDLIIAHCAGWMQRAGFEWPAGAVTEYFKRVQSRPAFKKAQEVRDSL